MLFILLFVVACFILPMHLDSFKNPGNNIFKRAWKEVIEKKNNVTKK